ncbi:MAG: response regulator transcription factor [Runella sp.]
MLLDQTIHLINLPNAKQVSGFLAALQASVQVFQSVEVDGLLNNPTHPPAKFTFVHIASPDEGYWARSLAKHLTTKMVLTVQADKVLEIYEQNILLQGIIDQQAGLDEYLKCLWQLQEGYFYMSDSLLQKLHRPSPAFDDVTHIFELLSSREREVVSLLAEGLTNQEISDQLCISAETVKNHKINIMQKLNLTNNNQLLLKVGEIRQIWRIQMHKIVK